MALVLVWSGRQPAELCLGRLFSCRASHSINRSNRSIARGPRTRTRGGDERCDRVRIVWTRHCEGHREEGGGGQVIWKASCGGHDR